MKEIPCCSCGIVYGVPFDWYWSRQKDQKSFFCPNGHSQSFQHSIADTLKREKEELERKFQAELNEVRLGKLVAERERDKAIKEKRKVERRIAHGVCPCCNKTFPNIANHMVTEHKDFRLPSGKVTKQIEAGK